MLDRFTDRARKVMSMAKQEALDLHSNKVGTEHLLLALAKEDEGIAAEALRSLDISYDDIMDTLKEVQTTVPEPSEETEAAKLAFTPLVISVMERSFRVARENNQTYVSTEHLLIGIVEEGNGMAMDILMRLGVSSASIKKAIEKLTAKDQDKKRPLAGAGAGRPGAGLPFFSGSDASQQKGSGTDTLKQFATNLTQKARDGELDPVIGREKEVQRMMEILSRRTKNNPLILGDPGVGKTAIVEGLAQQIAAGNVPENLMNQNIWTLDLPGLVAGAKYRGEFEERLKNVIQEATESDDMNKAAEITEQQKAAEIELAEAKAAWTAELDASPLTIDVSQIADIVSVTSGVPVSSLTESESRRLLQTESVLKTRIIGQDEAVEAVAKAVRRSRSPLKDPRRPGGSFIFLGPTGTGKTELAKTLAEYLFGSKDALISFDMSEFGSEFEVSKLIGSPPGYVGHDEGGQLTKAVRRHPYSVVLFDEIEKAHPDIFNILLQVLEEGRLTDSQGKTVDFRNTVIIMTSNVGAREIAQDASVGFGTTGEQGLTSSEIRGRAMGELKRLFRPELLNRIDDIVVFQKLSGENLTKIAHLLVDDLRQRLIANGMNIKLTDAAYDKIVAEGTDLTNGARPLRRAIQKLIEDPLSEELLAGEWGEGDTVLCDVADDKFVFSHGTGEIPAPRPAGTLGGDTAPAAPHTGNAAPVSGGVTSGPGGMMQAGSGAL